MLRHLINAFQRIILRNKVFSLLNIGGLAIRITAASLIFLWIENELSFNHHFTKMENLAAVMQLQPADGQLSTLRGGPVPLAKLIKGKLPGIKNIARLGAPSEQFFLQGDKTFVESGQYVDSTLLPMLNWKFIMGDRPSLTAPEFIVISASMSAAIFGKSNPVGKNLRSKTGSPWFKDGVFTITGVFQNLPANSSYRFNWLSPYKIAEDLMRPQWNKWDIPVETLVELEPMADRAIVNKSWGFNDTRRSYSKGIWPTRSGRS